MSISPDKLAKSVTSRLDQLWQRPYQLYINGQQILQAVIDVNQNPILDNEGEPQFSNPKIQQLKAEESTREFPNLQDKTVLYSVRLIQDERYNRMISAEYDWELSFDGGQNFYSVEVMKIETTKIEDFAWIIILGF